MSADPHKPLTDRRWTGRELAGLIAVIWLLALLLYFILTVD